MTNSADAVLIDLTVDERDFIRQTLRQWEASAAKKPFPFQILGLTTWNEFRFTIDRLIMSVSEGKPLSDLDWARVMFLTEITWVSDLIGCGRDFPIVTRFSDSEALQLVRGLQKKRAERVEPICCFLTGADRAPRMKLQK